MPFWGVLSLSQAVSLCKVSVEINVFRGQCRTSEVGFYAKGICVFVLNALGPLCLLAAMQGWVLWKPILGVLLLIWIQRCQHFFPPLSHAIDIDLGYLVLARNFPQGGCEQLLEIVSNFQLQTCCLKCAQLPEAMFKTAEGLFLSLLLKGKKVSFLENLRLPDRHKPATGCFSLWKALLNEQPFLLYLQKCCRLMSLYFCLCVLAPSMLGKTTPLAPGNGSVITKFHIVVKNWVRHSSVVSLFAFLNSNSYSLCRQSNKR